MSKYSLINPSGFMEYLDFMDRLYTKLKCNIEIDKPLIGYKKGFTYEKVSGITGEFNLPLDEVMITLEIPKGTKVCSIREDINYADILSIVSEELEDDYENYRDKFSSMPIYLELLECRAEKAIVKNISSFPYDSNSAEYKEAISMFDHDFVYKKGDIVSICDYSNTLKTYVPGIHFYKHRDFLNILY